MHNEEHHIVGYSPPKFIRMIKYEMDEAGNTHRRDEKCIDELCSLLVSALSFLRSRVPNSDQDLLS